MPTPLITVMLRHSKHLLLSGIRVTFGGRVYCKNGTKMKTLAFCILYLLGISEIVIGMLIGRIKIYAYEAPFYKELGLTSEKSLIFNHYIGIYKDQWHLVVALGVITIIATSMLLGSYLKDSRLRSTPINPNPKA